MTEIELQQERTMQAAIRHDAVCRENHAAINAAFDRLEAAFDAILGKKAYADIPQPVAPEGKP